MKTNALKEKPLEPEDLIKQKEATLLQKSIDDLQKKVKQRDEDILLEKAENENLRKRSKISRTNQAK